MPPASAVPFELWTNVFKRVSKQDFKNCSLVCKSWHSATLLLAGDSLHVELASDQIDLLAKDLEDYPSIGHKISRITIIKGSTHWASGSDQFMSVINACSGPLEVHFDTPNFYSYLTMLYCSKLVVPDIQRVSTSYLERYIPDSSNMFFDEFDANSEDTMQLYWKVNFRFRTTITSICVIVSDGGYFGSLDSHDDMIKYVTSFPLLQRLVAHYPYLSIQDVIDLPQILNRCPQLAYVSLNGSYLVRAAELLGEHGHSALVHLKLKSKCADINLLKYMISTLKNLRCIQLTLQEITVSLPLTESETEHQLEEFKKYARAVQDHHLCFIYKGERFCENNTDNECYHFEEEIQSINEALMDMFNDHDAMSAFMEDLIPENPGSIEDWL